MIDLKLKTLPESPGVYLMKDAAGGIIYIGKAKSLKNRVRQYFRSNKGHDQKVMAMVANVADFEYIQTASEMEALVLESNLIKKHQPHYNILLKDDRHYPYVKITSFEKYPRILFTRKVEKDKAEYFGPFRTQTVSETVNIINKIYKLRTCSKTIDNNYKYSKPCLNYHIGLCYAPCANKISSEKYKANFKDIYSFLAGKGSEVLKNLTEEMNRLSENLEYEKAAELRDRIKALSKLSEAQNIAVPGGKDRDVFAFIYEDAVLYIEAMNIREGKLLSRQQLSFENMADSSLSEMAESFILQYYSENSHIPSEILVNVTLENKNTLSQWLTGKNGRKTFIIRPERGNGLALMKLAEKNAGKSASETLEHMAIDRGKGQNAHNQLMAALLVTSANGRIEAYDISSTQGDNAVGSMVVFTNGSKNSSEYRLFKIKTVAGQDDYASLHETLTRRLKRAFEEAKEGKTTGFSCIPDLILADGGQGQASVLEHAVLESGLNIPVFGMVKDVHHKTKGIVSPQGEIILDLSPEAFHLLTLIQNEVHRVAVSFHRKLNTKKMIKSSLENIEGIGKTRRISLLRHFKTITNIKNASIEELTNAPGMNKKSAEAVFNYFKLN